MIPLAPHFARRWLRRLAVGIMALCGGFVLPANAVDFSATLSPEQTDRSGIDHLTAAQKSVLDTLIARELRAARQGGVTAFARTFFDRRTSDERHEAGLDQLTPSEQGTLNELVATALAKQQPAPLPVSMLHRSVPTATTSRDRLKVHGEVTLVVGAGRGGSFYGGSVYTEITDPEKKMTLGVGVATLRGHVPWWRCSAYDPFYADGWGW